jgi:hypothetical protein
MKNSQENFKQKWNVRQLNSTTIARLISELEGASYLLECINEEDFETIIQLKKKYYKMYFSMLNSKSKT